MKILVRLICLLLLLNLVQAQETPPVTADFRLQQTEPVLVVEVQLKMVAHVHIYTSPDRFFAISESKSSGLGKMELKLPTPQKYKDLDGTTVDTYSGTKTLRIERPYAGKVGAAWSFSGYIQYQACDDAVCYPPEKKEFSFQGVIPAGARLGEAATTNGPQQQNKPNAPAVEEGQWQKDITHFTIAHRGSGYMNTEKFLGFLQETETDKSPSQTGKSLSQNNLAGYNIWVVIAIVLFGGLMLNLTPCVLPIIPINLAIIGAGAQAGSRLRGFMLGGVYGLGMALAYGVLGLMVVLTGSTFGAINSSPWFNLGIAVLFVALALGMFDIIQIDFSKFRKSKRGTKKGNFIVAFFMGAISALLAGACVAPVLISVLLYASSLYSVGNQAGLLLPFLLGAGMALPWPFAGASLSFLPKPGGWMVKVKYAFGVFILLLAFYYGYEGVKLLRPHKLEGEHKGWLTSLDAGLAKARQENKPVFIDFWASWCKNCLVMDSTTFQDPQVDERLQNYVKIKYQAEKPDDMPAHAVLKHFGIHGLPGYVILKPKVLD